MRKAFRFLASFLGVLIVGNVFCQDNKYQIDSIIKSYPPLQSSFILEDVLVRDSNKYFKMECLFFYDSLKKVQSIITTIKAGYIQSICYYFYNQNLIKVDFDLIVKDKRITEQFYFQGDSVLYTDSKIERPDRPKAFISASKTMLTKFKY